MNGILANVQAERERQVKEWGRQDHHPSWWLTILAEEFGEAAKAILEGDFLQCHEELVQVSAVAASAAESIERHNWSREAGLASLQREVKELREVLAGLARNEPGDAEYPCWLQRAQALTGVGQ